MDAPEASAERTRSTGLKTPVVSAGVALLLLALANAFNLADRVLIGVVQEPIKGEFGLTDLQLGLLGGPAFAILYSLLSIPIARLADRTNRITVLSIALTLWSGLTALCGVAASYTQLLLMRAGVSVGEAGGTAPAISYLSDVFTAERRATALAVFSIGGPAGAILATIIGGYVAQESGWRMTFLVIGAPGLLLAIAIRLLLREVRAPLPAEETPGYRESLAVLLRKRSYVHICAANVFAAFALTAISQYLTSFLIREHELSLATAAAVLGAAAGLFGTAGAFLGGFLADRAARRNPANRTLVISGAFVIAALAFLVAWWAPLAVAVVCIVIGVFMANAFPGVSFAVASAVAPQRQRATAIAFLTLASNLLGYALGPPILGAISDAVSGGYLADAGIDPARCAADAALCREALATGLRWALTFGTMMLFGAAFHQWRASRTLVADTEG